MTDTPHQGATLVLPHDLTASAYVEFDGEGAALTLNRQIHAWVDGEITEWAESRVVIRGTPLELAAFADVVTRAVESLAPDAVPLDGAAFHPDVVATAAAVVAEAEDPTDDELCYLLGKCRRHGVLMVSDSPAGRAALVDDCGGRTILLPGMRPGGIYPVSEYPGDGPPEADTWFWQSGDNWVAVVADHERATWFGAPGGEEIPEGTPDVWAVPIDKMPPSGTLRWATADGLEHTAPVPVDCTGWKVDTQLTAMVDLKADGTPAGINGDLFLDTDFIIGLTDPDGTFYELNDLGDRESAILNTVKGGRLP